MATVEEIQAQQRTDVADVFAEAADFVDQLRSLESIDTFETTGLPTVEYGQDATQSAVDFLLSFFPPRPGTADPISVDLPEAPIVQFSQLESIIVPEFTQAAPTLNLPAAPDGTLPTAPAAPTVADIDIPATPTLSFPTAPVISAVVVPDVPSIDIPAFTANLPTEDFLAPSNTFAWAEEAYSSVLLDAQKTKLLDNLLNGGYGIEPLDEAQLWERARAREEEQASQARREVVRQQARRGFPLPPGSMQVSLERVDQDLQDKVSTLSRDIALRRSELYVDNRKFTIQEVRGIETVLIGFHNSVQERGLNGAKAALDAAVAIFRAQLDRHNSRLEAYRAEAQVYESRIRAALANVEIYRVTMEGKKLETETQRNAVELYRAQLAGLEAVVNVFRVQMEAANVRAGVERTKIDAFRALIDAYQSQIQAKVAQFNMHESQIRGEVARTQAFQAQVQAYNATIEGLKAKSEIRLGNLRAEAERARAQIDVYRGQISGAELDLKAQTETIDAILRNYGIDVQAYSAQINALSEGFRLQAQRDRDSKDALFKTAEIKLANARHLFEGAKEVLANKARAHDIAARYFATVLGGLVQAVQGITSKTAS